MNVPCSWWEYTGRHGPFVDGISSPIMRNIATGEEVSGSELPIGALWALDNSDDHYTVGADGLAVACRLPGGHTWYIDGRASNCTMKDDHEHRCWVRHGTVGERLHVDKAGLTCAAGAGSISIRGYHGFLHNGVLTDV